LNTNFIIHFSFHFQQLGKVAITPVIGFIGEIDVNSLELNPEEVRIQ